MKFFRCREPSHWLSCKSLLRSWLVPSSLRLYAQRVSFVHGLEARKAVEVPNFSIKFARSPAEDGGCKPWQPPVFFRE